MSCERYEIRSDRPPVKGEKPSALSTEIIFLDGEKPPKMIYDPVYIDYDKMSADQSGAFSELRELVEGSVGSFLLQPGEMGFIDNYRVAHGRPMYKPRYDGTDRWLKRVQISTDFARFAHLAVDAGRVLP